ncbi:type I-E CRISPR-associated protein Cas7/Cse4/CasC [Rhizohabitans arisaemae]|uniref:type I-E CRISPR-associated protein Cas7/Cse4/CasC n=1 Tax=Rhizohabitans arisaemae TaxID=2720610 RepID=UPI0024B0A5E1|nr:type I-E CRISPR-associated protein Cas7/Cse4/CasC [Rhizohabitans arisaemae]
MKNHVFVDVHVLHTVPPANLNRDDLGNPKEAYFGGVRRSRVSSQAWKRASRMSFAADLPEQERGTRTKRILAQLSGRLAARTGVGQETAARIAAALLKPLGITAGKKADETAYLLFFGYRQLDDIIDLVADRVGELVTLDDAALAEQVKQVPVSQALQQGHPLDVALFGRMVADIPAINVDASVQVAHALSTHAVELEFDYYTSVDDQNEREETGAGMIGTIGFNSATLYRYATIGLHQLEANLGDREAAANGVSRFVDHFARSIPSGYQNSFAHRTRPSLVALVVRADQPVNLVSAFERPVVFREDGEGIAAESAVRLAREYRRSVELWGDKPAHTAVSHAFETGGRAAGEIKDSFGDSVAFPELLDGLRVRLGKLTGQS